jgi:outer membrane protein insertion porin family
MFTVRLNLFLALFGLALLVDPRSGVPVPRVLAAPSKAAPNKATPSKSTSSKSTSKPPTPQKSATSTAIIKSIKIEGEKKIEESAIRAKIKTQVGDVFQEKTIRDDILSVFQTGFFDDIRVSKASSADGGLELTYAVLEKPTISAILFEGNDDVEEKDLTDAVELKAYEILDMAKVRTSIEKMLKIYEEKGFFLAKIESEIRNDETGSVQLVFKVVENDKVKVAQIRFLGNRQIPSNKLKAAMQTQEGGFFSFMSGSGSYKQDTFERDVQALYYLVYYNEGFIQAQIDRPQVYVTPDKKNIYITIRVEEGEKYQVGEVNFSGDILFQDQELFDLIKVKKNELFVYSVMQGDLRSLQAKYGDLGYAYANIIPRTRIREKDRLVDITYEIDKGNKVYINRITVKGNTKTRDKVVRREMQINEGELYNETRRRESEARVRRLGFFDEVVFNTSTPQGRPDLMDIEIVVKERNTGQIQLGAGYSNFGGFLINGQIRQTNLSGKGQSLGISVDYNRVQSIFNFNFTEPNWNDTDWSVGGDIYYRKREIQQAEYQEDRKGGVFRIGHPLAPDLIASVGYKYDITDLTLRPASEGGDSELFPVETANGVTSGLVFSLSYDKRNDRMMPTDGVFSSVSLEYNGIGGDLNYTKGLANFRYYKPVIWNIVWRNNLNYGIVKSNDSSPVPFNQLFLLGGANSLRGFDWFSIGRRKFSSVAAAQLAASTDDPRAFRPFGGEQELFYNLEFQFPLVNEAGILGVVFYDIGYADDTLEIGDFRSNFGFGFRWFSPIGPLRFEWGFPIDRDAQLGERSVNFEFAIGAPF